MTNQQLVDDLLALVPKMDPDAVEITGDACRFVGDAGILRSFADALASRAKKEKKSQVDRLMFLQEHAVAQLVNGEYGALNKSSATLSRVAPVILREAGKARILDEERSKEAARAKAQAAAVERADEAADTGAGGDAASAEGPEGEGATGETGPAGGKDESSMSIEDRAEITAKQLERLGARRFLQWSAVAALMDTEAPVTVGVCPRIGDAAEAKAAAAAGGEAAPSRGAVKAAERRDAGAAAVLQRVTSALLANPLEDRQPESVHLLLYALQLARRPVEALRILNGPINRRAALEQRYVPVLLPGKEGEGEGGEGEGKGKQRVAVRPVQQYVIRRVLQQSHERAEMAELLGQAGRWREAHSELRRTLAQLSDDMDWSAIRAVVDSGLVALFRRTQGREEEEPELDVTDPVVQAGLEAIKAEEKAKKEEEDKKKEEAGGAEAESGAASGAGEDGKGKEGDKKEEEEEEEDEETKKAKREAAKKEQDARLERAKQVITDILKRVQKEEPASAPGLEDVQQPLVLPVEAVCTNLEVEEAEMLLPLAKAPKKKKEEGEKEGEDKKTEGTEESKGEDDEPSKKDEEGKDKEGDGEEEDDEDKGPRTVIQPPEEMSVGAIRGFLRWIIRDADDPKSTTGVYPRSRVQQTSMGRRQRAVAALLGLVYLEGRLLDATDGKAGSGEAAAAVSGIPAAAEEDAKLAEAEDARLAKGEPAPEMSVDEAMGKEGAAAAPFVLAGGRAAAKEADALAAAKDPSATMVRLLAEWVARHGSEQASVSQVEESLAPFARSYAAAHADAESFSATEPQDGCKEAIQAQWIEGAVARSSGLPLVYMNGSNSRPIADGSMPLRNGEPSERPHFQPSEAARAALARAVVEPYMDVAVPRECAEEMGAKHSGLPPLRPLETIVNAAATQAAEAAGLTEAEIEAAQGKGEGAQEGKEAASGAGASGGAAGAGSSGTDGQKEQSQRLADMPRGWRHFAKPADRVAIARARAGLGHFLSAMRAQRVLGTIDPEDPAALVDQARRAGIVYSATRGLAAELRRAGAASHSAVEKAARLRQQRLKHVQGQGDEETRRKQRALEALARIVRESQEQSARDSTLPTDQLPVIAASYLADAAQAHVRRGQGSPASRAAARHCVLEALALCELAREDGTADYRTQLLRAKLLAWVGAAKEAHGVLDDLRVRSVQWESVSSHFAPDLERLGSYSELQGLAERVIMGNQQQQAQLGSVQRVAMLRNTLHQVVHFARLRERMARSLVLAQANSTQTAIVLPVAPLEDLRVAVRSATIPARTGERLGRDLLGFGAPPEALLRQSVDLTDRQLQPGSYEAAPGSAIGMRQRLERRLAVAGVCRRTMLLRLLHRLLAARPGGAADALMRLKQQLCLCGLLPSEEQRASAGEGEDTPIVARADAGLAAGASDAGAVRLAARGMHAGDRPADVDLRSAKEAVAAHTAALVKGEEGSRLPALRLLATEPALVEARVQPELLEAAPAGVQPLRDPRSAQRCALDDCDNAPWKEAPWAAWSASLRAVDAALSASRAARCEGSLKAVPIVIDEEGTSAEEAAADYAESVAISEAAEGGAAEAEAEAADPGASSGKKGRKGKRGKGKKKGKKLSKTKAQKEADRATAKTVLESLKPDDEEVGEDSERLRALEARDQAQDGEDKAKAAEGHWAQAEAKLQAAQASLRLAVAATCAQYHMPGAVPRALAAARGVAEAGHLQDEPAAAAEVAAKSAAAGAVAPGFLASVAPLVGETLLLLPIAASAIERLFPEELLAVAEPRSAPAQAALKFRGDAAMALTQGASVITGGGGSGQATGGKRGRKRGGKRGKGGAGAADGAAAGGSTASSAAAAAAADEKAKGTAMGRVALALRSLREEAASVLRVLGGVLALGRVHDTAPTVTPRKGHKAAAEALVSAAVAGLQVSEAGALRSATGASEPGQEGPAELLAKALGVCTETRFGATDLLWRVQQTLHERLPHLLATIDPTP